MKSLTRIFFKSFLFLMLFSYSYVPALAGYAVYGVRNEFPMADGQKLFRDIYVNMGAAQGLKIGTKLDVYRQLNTADQLNQKTGPNINFRIARVKVIHVEDTVAVARVLEISPAEDIPNFVFADVMVGDAVDVARK